MTWRVNDAASWADVQRRMRSGATLSPLLPLGEDAAYLWIPKNGCTTLKRAWLQLQRQPFVDNELAIHSSALRQTIWCMPDDLREVVTQRQLVAIWRDPIDRFVSACRSHLSGLTTARVHARFKANAKSPDDYRAAVAYHDQLYRNYGLQSFPDGSEPADVMNAVALQLGDWIACDLDWSHHTLPQVSYLGGDPGMFASILGMEQIATLLKHWEQASGFPLDATPQHVSSELTNTDPWRRLQREQLSPAALQALKQFYAADWAFLDLAQQLLVPIQTKPTRQAA